MTQPVTGYTDDEIQAAVSQLVQSSISRPNDTLGPKRSDITFGDIQNAAIGVFLLYPKAPFYCMQQGAQRLIQQLQDETTIIQSLIQAIQAVGRSVLPVNDLTPLANAVAALQALGSAATGRTSSFTSIKTVPAYQRFSANVQNFLSQNGPAVKSGGQVVQTPQQARGSIPGLVSQLQAAHQALIGSVQTLAQGQADYSSVNLAATVAQLVIGNATTVLNNHLQALTPQQPTTRLSSLRQVILDALACQSVVTQFGNPQTPTDIYLVTGTGFPYSDSSHLANPAEAVASLPGPYNVQSPNQYLDLYMDGAGATARSQTTASTVNGVPFTNTAQFDGVIGPDVQAGDYIFVKSGPNAGTRWVIQQILSGQLVATGVLPPVNDTNLTLEILPPPSAEVVLPFAISAQILGIVPETQYSTGAGYIIGNGTHPIRPSTSGPIPNNDLLIVQIGSTAYNCPLTLSADGGLGGPEATPRTAQQVCNDINAVILAHGFQAVPYFPIVEFQGLVTETSLGGANARFDLVGGFGNFTNTVNNGDLINVLTGDPTQIGLWKITVVAPTSLTATNVNATPSINQSISLTIQVGAPLRFIKIVAVNPTNAVNNLVNLTIVNDNGVGSAGAATLGLSPGGTSRSRFQTSKDIAMFITQNTTVAAATTQFTVNRTVSGHTNPTNAFILTLSELLQTVSTSVVGPLLNAPVVGAASAGVVPGDVIMERSGAHPGTVWQVTVVSDVNVQATLLAGTGASQAGVQLEFGPNVALTPFMMVRITTGPNHGDYYVQSQNYLDIALVSTMPQPFDPTTNTQLSMTVQLGIETLVIESTSTTTGSVVKLRGPASALFYLPADPAVAAGVAGTTIYFQIPQVPQGLENGDLLQLFASNYNLPSQVQSITDIEGQILTLDGAVASNVSWVFGPNAQVPFARLHTGHVADFTTFMNELLGWAALPEQQALFFTNFNRLINPLIANSQPTAVQVNSAIQALGVLYGELSIAGAEAYNMQTADTLEAILGSYTVPQQPSIDALVRSYLEKGADRAVDLLLAGSFSTFFGVTPETSSYAGQMTATARNVLMNDLPVQKINRTNTQTSQFTGTTTDPDPEYNFDDGTSATPDPLGPDDLANGS